MGGLVKKPNLTRATEAGKEGRGETETLRIGTRYKAQSEEASRQKATEPTRQADSVDWEGARGKAWGLPREASPRRTI